MVRLPHPQAGGGAWRKNKQANKEYENNSVPGPKDEIDYEQKVQFRYSPGGKIIII